jgi:ABC-type glycerol-3-phosphate transport system substrate-binding protein
VAFAREDVAMMFAPSWRAFEIMDMNPDLDFGIAPVPKLSESEYGWATYWAEGVNVNSKNKDAAWQLLKYLSSKEVLRKLHSSQKSIRAFGEIFPRQDMVSEVSDELVTPFLEDAPQAKSWYLCSYTHDDGINDKMIGYYQDAVNNASSSGVDDETLQTLDQGVKQILRQYGVTTSTTQ